MKVAWSINLYDNEGDKYQDGIILFVGDYTMLRFDDISQLEEFQKSIQRCIPEIKDYID